MYLSFLHMYSFNVSDVNRIHWGPEIYVNAAAIIGKIQINQCRQLKRNYLCIIPQSMRWSSTLYHLKRSQRYRWSYPRKTVEDSLVYWCRSAWLTRKLRKVFENGLPVGTLRVQMERDKMKEWWFWGRSMGPGVQRLHLWA